MQEDLCWSSGVVSPEVEGADLKTKLLQNPSARCRLSLWQNTADYAWQTGMQTGTKLPAKRVSEVLPMVSEVWTSTIR